MARRFMGGTAIAVGAVTVGVIGATSAYPAPDDAPSGESREVSAALNAGPEVRLEVKFDEDLNVRGADDAVHSESGRSLSGVKAVLDQYDAEDLTPFVDDDAAQRLKEIADEARERTGEPVPDLSAWYTLTLPADADVDEALAELRELPEVDFAEPAPEPAPPPRATSTPDFTPLQRYFGSAAQNGIDAVFSREDPRIRGGDIKIVDLEYNWNPFHEDLQLDWSTDLGEDRFVRVETFGDEHGTAVFGELVAGDNGFGVTGGVPDAEIYGISPVEVLPGGNTAWRPGPALAFLAASEGDEGPFLEPGDAVLLEQQGGQVIPDADCPVDPGTCYSPLEWNVAVHDAIRLLTGMGVTVVATGGNGHNSTDHPAYTRDGEPWFRPENHSGSILVGAGHSSTRERLGFSNHGPRFDLQGWGHQITTTGYCSLYCVEDDHNIRYSDSFGGTSGAGPIVTTAVVAIQSYMTSAGQDPWTAEQVRDVLVATGQPQGPDTAGQHVGPLPDLQVALKSIEVDPPESTLTFNQRPSRDGWYVNPKVTLEADDGWGSGVERIEYRVDGGSWTTYESPFRVFGEGERSVDRRAVDQNGNVEAAEAVVFKNRGRGADVGSTT